MGACGFVHSFVLKKEEEEEDERTKKDIISAR